MTLESTYFLVGPTRHLLSTREGLCIALLWHWRNHYVGGGIVKVTAGVTLVLPGNSPSPERTTSSR